MLLQQAIFKAAQQEWETKETEAATPPALVYVDLRRAAEADPMARMGMEMDEYDPPSPLNKKSCHNDWVRGTSISVLRPLRSWRRCEVWAISSAWARTFASVLMSSSLTQRSDIVTIAIAVSDGPYLPMLQLACLLTRPTVALVPIDLSDPRLPLILDDAVPALVVVGGDKQVETVRAALAMPTEFLTLANLINIVSTNTVINDLKPTPLNWTLFSADEVSHIYFTSGSTGRPKGCIVGLGALSSYCLVAKPAAHRWCPSDPSIGVDDTNLSVVFVASSHTFDPSLADHFSTLADPRATVARAPRSLIVSALATCLILSDATHVCTNPSLFDSLDALPPRLQVVALGGEVMGKRVVDLCINSNRKIRLLNTYGVTECTVYQMCAHVLNLEQRRFIGSGGMLGNNIYLMRPTKNCVNGFRERKNGDDDDTNENLLEYAPHEMERITNDIVFEWMNEENTKELIGEIWIGGAQVGFGYLKREELTKNRFIEHHEYGKLFRTGDLARVHVLDNSTVIDSNIIFDFGGSVNSPKPCASLVFAGRGDTQIKVNGQRVEIEEVEQAILNSLQPVISALVVVWNKDLSILVAYVVPSNSSSYCNIDYSDSETPQSDSQRIAGKLLSDIISYVCEKRLPRHMIPSKFKVLQQLPFTPTGKISRSELANKPVTIFDFNPEVDDNSGELTQAVVAWEEFIRSVWKSVLGLETHKIYRNTRFVELGGDSLKALLVSKKLAELLEKVGASEKVGCAVDIGAGDIGNDVITKKNGGFGELLGVLAPAELIKRPRLKDFAEYLATAYANYSPPASVETSSGQINKVPINFQSKANPITTARTTAVPLASSTINSFLYKAVASDLPELVEYLIKTCGASVNGVVSSISQSTKTTRETTPLHIACINSHEKVAQALLKNGALVSLLDPNSTTAFHFACQRGPLSLVKLLLNASISSTGPKAASNTVFQTDLNEQTALHYAARSGAPNAVLEFLVDITITTGTVRTQKRRILDQKDVWGRTPLHWAAVNGHSGCVKVLVALGADVKMKDAEGEDALEIAERRARCGEALRGSGIRASVFGDIAKILGGSGATKSVSRFLQK
ncbi:hypothetical protein HK100_003138 [Physocladia obscura]|uniref:Uncharacterized protein n=1 Tax=Physocladia obscura TaxID=109957 RepID=A0AAD5XDR5_9FUNG|nr:hypothetical protein HK100_003138 [Physocladia obscura]